MAVVASEALAWTRYWIPQSSTGMAQQREVPSTALRASRRGGKKDESSMAEYGVRASGCRRQRQRLAQSSQLVACTAKSRRGKDSAQQIGIQPGDGNGSALLHAWLGQSSRRSVCSKRTMNPRRASDQRATIQRNMKRQMQAARRALKHAILAAGLHHPFSSVRDSCHCIGCI